MGTFVGILIASLVVVYAVNELLHRAVFHRFIENDFTSRMLAGLVTYCVSVVAYGFALADGGSFRFEGLLIYLVPSLVALVMAIKSGREERATAGYAG